jgi:streptogramin lyase
MRLPKLATHLPRTRNRSVKAQFFRPRLEVLETRTTPAFVSASSIPGAGGATSMVTGDFNHDGKLDLAVAALGEQVNVFLGNGDGTFQAPIHVPTDSPVGGLAVGDLDHDGNLDLVATSSVDDKVVVFLGNGDGTFQPGVDYVVGSSPGLDAAGSVPGQVLLADVTGNGNLDIVATTWTGVGLLMNKGDGTFAAATAIAGLGSVGVIPGHFYTNDTRLDLVGLGGSVLLFRGNGDGTFQASGSVLPLTEPNGPQVNPLAVAVADLNGDGNDDLIVYEGGLNQIEVLLGKGDGTFQPPVFYPVGQGLYALTQIQVADLRQDGKLDVVAVNPLDNHISVLLGNGDGTMQPAVTYVVGHTPDTLAIGDFSGHGHLDIAVADYVGSDIEILQGNGTGTFQTAMAYGAGTGGANSIVAGDVNRDGIQDLVVANQQNDTVSVLLGKGDGSFQPPVTYAVGAGPVSVQLADLPGNGNLDIITANASASDPNHDISILLGNGDGTFQSATYVAAGNGTNSVVAADLNGDGKMDLAVTNSGDRTLSILFGNGDGTFQPPVNYGTDLGPNGVVAGDLNGDGKPDLVVTNYGGRNVGVYLNQGGGSFAAATYYPDESPSGPLLASLRGNGVLDLITACANNSIGILLGNGDGTFQPVANYGSNETPVAVAACEVDGDQKLDLAVLDQASANVRVFRGNGDGTFQETAVYPGAGRTPQGMIAVDTTGTGQLDLAIADGGDVTQGITILHSQSASAVSFNLTALAIPQPGVPSPFVVTAVDSSGQPVPTYSGTVHFTSNDPASTLPADASLTNGTGTFNVTFGPRGNDFVRATDTANSSITGTSQSFRWVDHFRIDGVAGTTLNFTVTAVDQTNQPVPSYTGTIQVTTTDTQANVPVNYTFLASDLGVHAGTIVLNTPGSQVVTITDVGDPSKTGSITVVVPSPPSIHFAVTGFEAGVTAGVAGTFTVTAEDAHGNVVSTYSGTVAFTTTDPQVTPPANSGLTNGVGTFSLTFKTAGLQSITATDTVTSNITGTERWISVAPATVSTLIVSAVASRTYPGVEEGLSVTAKDPYGNLATSYNGTIAITRSDPAATLPPPKTIYGGEGTVALTFNTLGTQSVTATDSANGLSGSVSNITVFSDPVTDFTVPTSGAGPRGVTLGPDGNFWFAENAVAQIGRMTPAGNFTEFPQPNTGCDPIGIVAGPDGNLWFTEFFADKIGRLTPGGALTVFNLPTANCNAQGITVGPDGNLWFTETGGKRIGQITPFGGEHEFLLGPNSFPAGITSGPDHNLWFTESRANKIGRITPEGMVTEFPIPAAASNPQEIVTGPDGNLWFTEQDADQIGRIDLTGHVIEYAIPTAAAGPQGITVGPDGNLWFTELTGNKVGRISVTGPVVEKATLADVTGPYDIMTGPDGNIWFSEENGHIGQVVVPGVHLVLAGFPSAITAGQPATFTVTAEDAQDNPMPTYAGTIHFTSSDPSANLPADATLTNGTGTFSATLNQAGEQTITATAVAASSITGTSGLIQVTAAAADHLAFTAQEAGSVAGTAVNPAVEVRVFDRFGNLVSSDNTDQVTLAIASGTGGFTSGSTTTQTASAGVAIFNNLAFNAAGDYTLSVTGTGGLGGTPFTARVARLGSPPSWLSAVAGNLTHSVEYYTGIITAAYQRYLGRGPDSAGLASWLAQMQSGLTDEHLEAGFLGSPEYIAGHGGAGAGWVRGMYKDLLGRTPSQAEVDNWVQVLASGVSTTAVAFGFAASSERESNRVTADYLQYLGRNPAATEVAGWVNAFESGAATNEDVVAGFVGSPEYFQKHFGNASDWFASAFQALFGYPATQSSSVPSYLPAVANTLTHSAEYYTDIITAAYQRYLGRAPDSAGLASWLAQMQNGLTDEHLEAGFLGSPEYIAGHGGAGAGWVRGMYQDLLGRTPSQAEVDNWVQVLASGVSTTAVAFSFAASSEREGNRVTADYVQYLGRNPAAAEVAGWVNAFETGAATNEAVVAGFVGSPEYFRKQNSEPQDWWFQAVLVLYGPAGF